MIACHASPESKSTGLARIQNFKVGISNIGGGGGGGGGGVRGESPDRPNTSGEGEGRPRGGGESPLR